MSMQSQLNYSRFTSPIHHHPFDVRVPDMARPAPLGRSAPLIIEISSDEESEDEVVFLNSPPRHFATAQRQPQPEQNHRVDRPNHEPFVQQPVQPPAGVDLNYVDPVFNNTYAHAHNQAFEFDMPGIDLGDFFSERTSPQQLHTNTSPQPSIQTVGDQSITDEPVTESVFSTRLLEIFPDIALDHLDRLFKDGASEGTCSEAWTNQIIHQLLDEGKYPRERDRRQELKRKRNEHGENAEFEQYETTKREAPLPGYFEQAKRILSEEFPEIRVNYIGNLLKAKQFLFPTFLQLYEDEQNHSSNPQPSFKTLKPRIKARGNRLPSTYLAGAANMFGHNELSKELDAAKKRMSENETRRRKEREKVQKEEQNEQTARANNAMTDCACCFTETPNNRMTFCSADEPHYFCYDCARKYVQTLIGDSKCSTSCMDFSGCQAPFAREQLKFFLDTKTFEKLEHMQQQEDIRLAGLDDLVDCPFCDFKAVYPPVEVDKEFRCQNPDCEKVSCRLCSRETHIPLSCTENEKENRASLRHTMEEAMTEALVRTCNNCKNKFIKEIGCNKMTCPRCGNKQCYVCSQNISNYSHFERGQCQMNDDTNTRHQQEVAKAEEEARRKLLESNPDLTNEDLDIKVSAEVKRDEQQRNTTNLGFPLPGPNPHGFGILQLPPVQMAPGYNNPFGPFPPPPLPPPNFIRDVVLNRLNDPNPDAAWHARYGEVAPPLWPYRRHHYHHPPPPPPGQGANPPMYQNRPFHF